MLKYNIILRYVTAAFTVVVLGWLAQFVISLVIIKIEKQETRGGEETKRNKIYERENFKRINR
jgi:hypothetical protein